jgi:IS1 family transposase
MQSLGSVFIRFCGEPGCFFGGLSQSLQLIELADGGNCLSASGTRHILYLLLLANRSKGESMRVIATAFHFAQLSTHNSPLKYADNYQAEGQQYDSSRQADHKPFGPLHPIFDSMYCGIHVIFGYCLCWWGGWVIWQRWRMDRLSFWSLLYGLLFYALAASVVWHELIVLQKLLDATDLPYYNNYMSNVLSADKQIGIIGALCEDSAIRSTERMTGVHRDTIMRLGVRVGQGCAATMDAKMVDLPCTRLELDEIRGFVGKKEKQVRPSEDPSLGDVWTFCAIDADTKLVPAFKVGKRDAATANAFVGDIAGRMKNRVQISTDGLRAYVEAVEQAFGPDVDYAQIIKTYGHVEVSNNRRYSAPDFVSSEKKVLVGMPDYDLISTSYVERLNATTRLHMRRLTRLTLAFSKKLENFEAAVGLHFAYYNFVKRHNTLRCTSAMAAGVSPSFWTVADLMEASA